MSSNSPHNAGFSLLEVLISIAVLVFISLGLTQTISETFKLRDTLMVEGDFYNGIRLALDVVQRDVAMMYSPSIMLPPKVPKTDAAGNPLPEGPPDPAEAREMQNLLATDAGQTSPFWAPAIDRSGIRPSRFVGTDTKLTFVSASNIRIYRDSLECDFVKITYEILPDNVERDGNQVLTKTESPNVFNDDDRRDREVQRIYPLLRGISQLRYRYYRKDKDAWSTNWDSDKEETRNIYPDIIEVSLEVKGPKSMSFDGKYRFRPEVPLRGMDPST